ncbi:MAG: pilus assembly FimT family protein [bacterium]
MQRNGYTLVEIAIVLVVIGMILAAGLPAFGNFRSDLQRQQAREQVVQSVRSARQAAVTRHIPVIMTFGNGAATTDVTYYRTHVDNNNDGVWQSGELRWQKTMPKGTRLSLVSLTPTDLLKYDISGILIPGTTGGFVVIAGSGTKRDTLYLAQTGMAYRQ